MTLPSSGLLRATVVAWGEPGLMLVELSVVEQRYHAVMEVLSGGILATTWMGDLAMSGHHA